MESRPIALTDQGVDVLLRLAKGIEKLAEELAAQNNKTTQIEVEAIQDEPVTVAKEITLEQVRAILADKSRAGHTETIRKILESRGVGKLSELNPTEYASVMAEAEAL